MSNSRPYDGDFEIGSTLLHLINIELKKIKDTEKNNAT